MNEVIHILNDVLMETRTIYRAVGHDGPLADNMLYIEDMTKRAIEKLTEHG